MSDRGAFRLFDSRKRNARTNVYVFAHAGGGRFSYANWDAAFSSEIAITRTEIVPPRWIDAETAEAAREVLREEIVARLAEHLSQPGAPGSTWFFGHSLGAILAYEACRDLRAMGVSSLRGLAVSGRRAPQQGLTARPLCAYDDAELFAALPTLMPIGDSRAQRPSDTIEALHRIRAHLFLSDIYTYRPAEPFAFPILSLRGAGDSLVSRALMSGWSDHTTRSFAHHEVPGEHFFTHDGTRALIGHLSAAIKASWTVPPVPLHKETEVEAVANHH